MKTIFKNTILIVLLVITGGHFAKAQNTPIEAPGSELKSFGIGLRAVHLYDLPSFRFDGPLSRDMQGLNGDKTDVDLGMDIYVEKMFTPLIGLQLGFRFANITGANEVEYYQSRFTETSLDAIIIWSNLDPARIGNKWNIYTKAGLGTGNFDAEQFLIEDDSPDNSFKDDFWEGHVGMGVQYKLNNYLRLELEGMYNVAYNDGFDGFDDATGSDPYLTTAIGLTYSLGKKTRKPLYAVNYFGDDYLKRSPAQQQSAPRETIQTETQAEVSHEELNTLRQQLDEIALKLEIAGAEIEKLRSKNTVDTITLPAPTVQTQNELAVYFESNSSTLTAGARKKLIETFGTLEDRSQRKLEVVSFVDKYGPDDHNDALKLRRAESAIEFLTSIGFTKENISMKKGETLDLRPRDQFLNRRVIIRF